MCFRIFLGSEEVFSRSVQGRETEREERRPRRNLLRPNPSPSVAATIAAVEAARERDEEIDEDILSVFETMPEDGFGMAWDIIYDEETEEEIPQQQPYNPYIFIPGEISTEEKSDSKESVILDQVEENEEEKYTLPKQERESTFLNAFLSKDFKFQNEQELPTFDLSGDTSKQEVVQDNYTQSPNTANTFLNAFLNKEVHWKSEIQNRRYKDDKQNQDSMLQKEEEYLDDEEEGSGPMAQRRFDFQEYEQEEYHDPFYMTMEEQFVEQMEQEVKNSQTQEVPEQDTTTSQYLWESGWNYQTEFGSSESDLDFGESESFSSGDSESTLGSAESEPFGSGERTSVDSESEFGFEINSLGNGFGSNDSSMNDILLESQFGSGELELSSVDAEFGSGENELGFVENYFGNNEHDCVRFANNDFVTLKNDLSLVENYFGSGESNFSFAEKKIGNDETDFGSGESESSIAAKDGKEIQDDYSELVEELQDIEGSLETLLGKIDQENYHEHEDTKVKEEHNIIGKDTTNFQAQEFKITDLTKYKVEKDIMTINGKDESNNSLGDIIEEAKNKHKIPKIVQGLVGSNVLEPSDEANNKRNALVLEQLRPPKTLRKFVKSNTITLQVFNYTKVASVTENIAPADIKQSQKSNWSEKTIHEAKKDINITDDLKNSQESIIAKNDHTKRELVKDLVRSHTFIQTSDEKNQQTKKVLDPSKPQEPTTKVDKFYQNTEEVVYSAKVLGLAGIPKQTGNLKGTEDLRQTNSLENKSNVLDNMTTTNDVSHGESIAQVSASSEANNVQEQEVGEDRFFFPAGHGLFFGFKLGEMEKADKMKLEIFANNQIHTDIDSSSLELSL